MGILGRITLGFGAHGEDGDEPLSFEAGHINLIVGPNNSGKSLFLRELSGIEPRARRSRWRRAETQSQIVERVAWGEELAAHLRARSISEVMDNEWSLVGERSWSTLQASLRRAAVDIGIARAAASERITATMAELLGLDSKVREFVDGLREWESDFDEELEKLTIAGAAYFVANFRAELAAEHEAAPEPTAPLSAVAVDPAMSAKRILHARLEEVIAWLWSETCEAIEPLKVATAELSPLDVLDLEHLGGYLLTKLPNGLLSLVRSAMDVPESVAPLDAEESARVEVIAKVAGWVFDPKALSDLADELERKYATYCWSDIECRERLRETISYLDGPARLSRTEPAQLQPFDEPDDDAPPILALLKSPERRALVRELVSDALGAHLVIDMVSDAPTVIWRLSSEAPDEEVESTYSEAAHAFYVEATPLSEKSDGIHALVGILASVVARDHGLIFIDEPEAFLHPPLVRKLARQLGQIAEALERQFFVATHSPDMLASVARGDIDVNVIRLTYRDGVPTARLLDGAALRRLALDPLMRSEAVLAALFHEGAVVCEAAADRVVYQEVNERLLLQAGGEGGLDGVKFLNAQNWQTVQRMVGPLRELGVAAAAVVDADVVFEKDFKTLLGVAGMPPALRMAVLQRRADLRRDVAGRLKQKRPRLKRDLIAALSDEERAVLDGVFDDCARYGIFVVPVGELEDWLSYLGVARRRGDKVPWLADLIARLGYDRGADDYVWPTEGDVWGFVARIMAWIADPKRAGLRVG